MLSVISLNSKTKSMNMIGDMVNCYDNHVNAEIVKVVVIVTCALLMN